jgi:putative transposase
VYTQASNRRHRRVGHLFQGRFKGILVDKEEHLLELARYVVLNPVRAGMVASADQWRWSSYQAMAGMTTAPKWLEVDGLLSHFGEKRKKAVRRYREFVVDGGGRRIWDGLRQQIYLGGEGFVEKVQAQIQVKGDLLSIPQAHRRPPPPSLKQIEAQNKERNPAIVAAYATGAYSYREIAEHFGVHLATVGRIVRKAMQQCEN